MDIFRRLTTPTLKKLYRFVLKRLVGRFLDDDISLEQLDVHLRAGRVELTDLNVNVGAVAELLPNSAVLPTRIHVGKLRVDISYSKLLTESLAFYVDDVLLEIAPAREQSTSVLEDHGREDMPRSVEATASVGHAEAVKANPGDGLHQRSSAQRAAGNSAPDRAQWSDSGEGLDFLAQWIEQITSKVKIVVTNVTAKIASVEGNDDDVAGRSDHDNSCFEVHLTSLKWCDETQESASFLAEPRSRRQSSGEAADRLETPGMGVTQKRLTLGAMTATCRAGRGGTRREVLTMGGGGCGIIKQNHQSYLGSPSDVAMDVDVSLRHADIRLSAEDFQALGTLASFYLARVDQPIAAVVEEQPASSEITSRSMFHEDFWYVGGFNAAGDGNSGELNFNTLSGLLGQYAAARARLAEAGGYSREAGGGDSHLSLGQSDVFYDCVDERDGSEQGAMASAHQVSAKFRLRMTGLDVALLLARGEAQRSRAGASEDTLLIRMRRISQTFHSSGTWRQAATEVGTLTAGFMDDGLRHVRVLEVDDGAESSPCVQIEFNNGLRFASDEASTRHKADAMVDIQCLGIATIFNARLVTLMSDFVMRSRPQELTPLPVKSNADGETSPGRSSHPKTADEHRVRLSLTLPKMTARLPADPDTCSSVAYDALLTSILEGSSPVGWTRFESSSHTSPALVLEVEGVNVATTLGSAGSPPVAVECSTVLCQMVLLCTGNADRGGSDHLVFLPFLEATRSVSGTPLKVEYGREEDIGSARVSGVARPADANLNFLHTWEPNEGMDNGLGQVTSSSPFDEDDHSQPSECQRQKASTRILLCDLPRLGVELSRLELVVLADILSGLSPPRVDPPRGDLRDQGREDSGQGHALQVLVEAWGATIVLHEAEAFAEEPGPHSYVLNLGNACIHVGGNEKSFDGYTAPIVTVSSRDVCVHETLRVCNGPSGKSNVGPVLFQPNRHASVYPSMEDLPATGFIPVLYQTKWAKGTSPVAAELALALSGPMALHKTITATLNLYDVSLRHTVTSTWLPRLLGLVVGDVPAGRAVLHAVEQGVGVSSHGLQATSGNLTKMFITVFNGVVDYMPQYQGVGPVQAAGRSGGSSDRHGPATEGRAVFPIGVLRVSSNMVAGAPMQGFKVIIRDIGLHMSNAVMDYRREDAGLCRGALDAHSGYQESASRMKLTSVQEYLETSHFVQIATLNFLDAFLRARAQVVTPLEAFTAVELWMGILHVYTCRDSLDTCQALLGEWWALVTECRAADISKTSSSAGKDEGRTPRAVDGRAEQISATSLLDDVQQDAFIPGSAGKGQSLTDTKLKAGGSAAIIPDGDKDDGTNTQSLVIEDYYCLSVASSAAPAAHGSVSSSGNEGGGAGVVGEVLAPSLGQLSFISEGISDGMSESEGPAQWLTAPKVTAELGEDLAMESAETSDSEGEGEKRELDAAQARLPMQQSTARRSAFGFSLPTPIEIELDVRKDFDAVDFEEGEEAEPSSIAVSSPLLSDGRDTKSDTQWSGSDDDPRRPRANSSSQERADARDQRDTDSSVEISEDVSPDMNATMPWAPASPAHSLPSSAQPEFDQARASPQLPRDAVDEDRPSQNVGPAKTVPLEGEQEARWLREEGEARGDTSEGANPAMETTSSRSKEFRVYPHYVPIPTAAEATSVPFLSGHPLSALGNGLHTSGTEGADVTSSQPIEQDLQFQLAIHDLTICWRLFKGRDWLQDSVHDEEVSSRHSHTSVEQRLPRVITREVHLHTNAQGKLRQSGPSRGSEQVTPSSADEPRQRKAELLDALLEDYQGERHSQNKTQIGRRGTRQPKVKRLTPRENRSTRSVKRTGRDTSCMLEIVLEHASLRLDSFHPGPAPSLLSNLLFSIKDLYASDTLTSSRPRKTLQQWRDDVRHPREFQQKMVTVRMTTRSPSDHFCPEDGPLGDEIMLKVRLLPVHLSFGQHTVDFLRSFAPPPVLPGNTSAALAEEKVAAVQETAVPFFVSCLDVGACKATFCYAMLRSSIVDGGSMTGGMTLPSTFESGQKEGKNRLPTSGHQSSGTSAGRVPGALELVPAGGHEPDASEAPSNGGFGLEWRRTAVTPVMMDALDMLRGVNERIYGDTCALTEELSAPLVPRKLYHLCLLMDDRKRAGLSAFVWHTQSWVQDITSNQLHKFLAGTTAVRPLVSVGKGVADLVLLPVEQYRRDGRVLRGLRKGTQSFLKAITIETLHTSHRLASFVARTLDDIVTQPGGRASLRGLEYYDEQPTGVLDSLGHAYDALAKEMQVAAQTIIAIPYEEHEEVVGPHGRSYVRSVARALPVAVLRPVVGASEALSCTLLGFRNYMSPVIRREEEGRWT